MKYKVDHENQRAHLVYQEWRQLFFLVSKSLFILLCRVNKNFVLVFTAKLTNPKSTNIPKGI